MIRRTAMVAVRLYQWLLSPYFAGSCRFVPSCSEYAREAIARHGVGRGVWLSVRRLSRCHPFCKAGFDPVPEPCLPSALSTKRTASSKPGLGAAAWAAAHASNEAPPSADASFQKSM